MSTNPSALVTGSTLSKYIKNITDDARKSLNGINTVTLQNSNNISLSTFNSEKIKINLLPGLNLKISDGATFNFKTLNTNKITIEISGIDVGFLGLNKVEINQTSITINIGLFSKTFELK